MFCGGLCFGWSSPSMAFLQSANNSFTISNSQASWITSLLQFGAALGPFPGALISKYFGPKVCILCSIVPYSVSFIMIIFAESAMMLYVSRIMAGLAIGLGYAATPIYIAEISENRNRGALMIIFSLSVNIGIVLISAVAPYVSINTMAEIMLIFPVLLITFILAPESPLYYVRIKEETKALRSLSLLRREKCQILLQEELDSMKTSTGQQMKLTKCLREFITPSNMKAFGIVFITILNQQLSGSIASMLYLEKIYASTNMNFAPNIAVVLTLLLMIFFSFISIGLPDVLGRKPLLIFSALGCVLSNALLGAYFVISDNHYYNIPNFQILAIVAINTLQISAALGLTPIPYMIAGEIFSANVKEVSICLISVIGALCGFATSKMFQVLEDSFGTGYVFFCLMTITLVLCIMVYIFLPETKGKSFNEIQELLKGSSFFYTKNSMTESVENIYDPKSEIRF